MGSKHFEKLGYSFKVFDDRNRLVFVTPVRGNASDFVREKLGYTPNRVDLNIRVGNIYIIKKFIPGEK